MAKAEMTEGGPGDGHEQDVEPLAKHTLIWQGDILWRCDIVWPHGFFRTGKILWSTKKNVTPKKK